MKTGLKIFIAFFAAVLGAAPAAAGTLKVSFVESGVSDFALTYAIKKGCMAERGLAIEKVLVEKAPITPLAAGQADLSFSGVSTVLSAYQNGAALKILAFMPTRIDYYAVSRYPASEASKIKALAGADTQGGIRLFTPFLEHLGLEMKNLKGIRANGEAVKYAMLKMGYADLFTATSAELARTVAEEKIYYLFPDPFLGERMEPRIITTSEKTLKKKGPELEKYVAAIYCALKAAAADKEGALGLLMSDYGYTREEAEAFHPKFAETVKRLDPVPSAARIAPSWDDLPDFKPAERRSVDGLAFPDYAMKAAKP